MPPITPDPSRPPGGRDLAFLESHYLLALVTLKPEQPNLGLWRLSFRVRVDGVSGSRRVVEQSTVIGVNAHTDLGQQRAEAEREACAIVEAMVPLLRRPGGGSGGAATVRPWSHAEATAGGDA